MRTFVITGKHFIRILTARLPTVPRGIPGSMSRGWVPIPWTYPPSRRDLVPGVPTPGKDMGPEILTPSHPCGQND